MKVETLQELYAKELQDLYGSEKLLVKWLAKMAETADMMELRQALSNHVNEARVQTTRIEKIFQLHGERPVAKQGKALEGILREAEDDIAEANNPNIRDAMIVAALFHDVGHLVVDVHNSPESAVGEVDDNHEATGARILSPLFGPAVAQPVSLHVTAKRWRCTCEPAYFDQLSEASKLSLKAQGGLLSDEECLRFEEHHGFVDALSLRTWDDEGKVVGLTVGTLDDYVGIVNSLHAAWSRGRHER